MTQARTSEHVCTCTPVCVCVKCVETYNTSKDVCVCLLREVKEERAVTGRQVEMDLLDETFGSRRRLRTGQRRESNIWRTVGRESKLTNYYATFNKGFDRVRKIVTSTRR